MRMPSTRRLAVLTILVLAAAAGSFTIARALHGPNGPTDPPLTAALATPSGTARPRVSTPTPGPSPLTANPDTTKGGWALPYLAADRAKPVYDQTINGITVGPTAPPKPSVACQAGSAQMLALSQVDQVAAAPVMVAPKYLPAGAALGNGTATACKNATGQPVVIGVDATYAIPADPAHRQRGGSLMVSRSLGQPSVRLLIPAERWAAGTIAGHPAAIAHPILTNGLGHSAIVVSSHGVVTTLQADNLTLDDLERIAEGLY